VRLTAVSIPAPPYTVRMLGGVLALLTVAVLTGCASQGGAKGSHHGTGGDQSPAAPTPAATLTTADNDRTVRLRPGQSLAVRLDPAGGMSWHTPAAEGAALRLASAGGGYPRRGPALATFTAVAPGRVTLHSITDAACLHSQPPCTLPQRTWQVTVVVAHSTATS
jgi:hypothetical protein